MDWIDLAQDRDRWWLFEDVVMNLQVPYNVGNFWPAEDLLASEEWLCSK